MPLTHYPPQPPPLPSTAPTPLNHYGSMAMRHAQQHRPKAFATLMAQGEAAMMARFQELGEATQNAIDDWIAAYLTQNPPPSDFMAKTAHLETARKLAEEAILPEGVFLPPEADEPPPMDPLPTP